VKKRNNFNYFKIHEKIKTAAEKVGMNHSEIRSIYLFGSMARKDADNYSDIDILFVVSNNPEEFYLKLIHDEDYKILNDWAIEIVEGGLVPFICDSKELVLNFDTLPDKILKEGILLYGTQLSEIIREVPQKNKSHSPNLLDLVRSL